MHKKREKLQKKLQKLTKSKQKVNTHIKTQ